MKLNPVGTNQTTIETDNLIVFFSYKIPIACQRRNPDSGKFEYFHTDTYFSRTTSKHLNNWIKSVGGNWQEKEQSFFDNLIK